LIAKHFIRGKIKMNNASTAFRIARLPIALIFSAITVSAFAAYPDHQIRMIVPYDAGGGADTMGRVVARALTESLGQSVVVENHPGASGIVGATMEAHATPDGYTVLFDGFPEVINAIAGKLSFNYTSDLAPVSQVAISPSVFVVVKDAPYKTVDQFVAYAKAHPGKMAYASYGIGGVAHLAGELLKNKTGIDMLHVPYKGGAPALVALMGGQVAAYFSNVSSAIGHIKDGSLLALGVTSSVRVPSLPDVPTFQELGYKDIVIQDWNGFFMPGKTPKDIVARFSKAVQAATASKPVHDKLIELGLVPVGGTSEQFTRFTQSQMATWGALIKSQHIDVQ
jgi:tripartite-type tricarboxylate transporter receptor subunit TctC